MVGGGLRERLEQRRGDEGQGQALTLEETQQEANLDQKSCSCASEGEERGVGCGLAVLLRDYFQIVRSLESPLMYSWVGECAGLNALEDNCV